MTQYPYVGSFKLSMTLALRDQLVTLLDTLEPTPLTADAVQTLERRGGVYQLFEDGTLVYVGKSAKNLPARLTKHRLKIEGRVDKLVEHITFRCAYVDEDLDAVAPETLLIKQFREKGESEWNTNGFGNNDPGRQRDYSAVKLAHFDRLHPIDLDKAIELHLGGPPLTLLSVMDHLKAALPYNFRFDSGKQAKATLSKIDVSADFQSVTTRTAQEWFAWLIERLPVGWVIVALPGYVIAYPDLNLANVPSRRMDWSFKEHKVELHVHEPEFAEGAVEIDASEPKV